jgi:hypothetical protein
MPVNCSKCAAKKLDIWFDGKKGEVLCGKCYVGGNDD